MIIPNVKLISNWLKISAIMVLIMVCIGGFTRLTHSGLSIIEWKPVTGVVPPIGINDWLIEFDKYKYSPEYKIINYNISLDEFKFLYLTEYIHRLMGRISGLVFLLPLGFFWAKGWLSPRLKIRSVLVLALGAAQGLMGWYMVKSGLSNEPYVSHFRLSAHLMIAVFMYSVLVWEYALLSLNPKTYRYSFPAKIYYLGGMSLTVCYFQIWLGGLVAGAHGGLIYNHFPLMGETLVPSELYNFKGNLELFINPAILQFWHRLIAYLLTIILLIYSYNIIQYNVKRVAHILQFTLASQLLLGVLTLLTKVNIIFALAHQFVAFILLGIILISNSIFCKQENLDHK